MYLDEMIFQEIFIDYLSKWKPGYYFSSRGLIKIEDMNNKHIENAIKMLKEARKVRKTFLDSIEEVEDTAILGAKTSYNKGEDLIQFKINELALELQKRM